MLGGVAHPRFARRHRRDHVARVSTNPDLAGETWAVRSRASSAAARRAVGTGASSVMLTVVQPGPLAQSCLDRAEEAVLDVERSCSGIHPLSDLALANAAPDRWHSISATLAAAIEEAERAHRETGSLFDPRRAAPQAGGFDCTAPWRPQVILRRGGWRAHLGGQPLDLDGISRGLGVRSAAAELAAAGQGYLVDAGDDGALGGVGPNGGGWRVGVESPRDPTEVVLVLELTDVGCATSSIPGADGDDTAVTVVDSDPAWALVLSSALLRGGTDRIRNRADHLGVAVAWIDRSGTVGTSTAMDRFVTWRRPGD